MAKPVIAEERKAQKKQYITRIKTARGTEKRDAAEKFFASSSVFIQLPRFQLLL